MHIKVEISEQKTTRGREWQINDYDTGAALGLVFSDRLLGIIDACDSVLVCEFDGVSTTQEEPH